MSDKMDEEASTCSSLDEAAATLLRPASRDRGAPWVAACPRMGTSAVAALWAVLLVLGLAFATIRGRGGGDAGAAAEAQVSGVVGLAEALDFSKVKVPSLGTVRAIYTYGAPATAHSALEDLQREDHCLGGLRSYNEDIVGAGTKQADAAAMSNNLAHARMATVVLRNAGESIYVPCPGETTWPNDKEGNVFAEWRVHWEDNYTPRLQKIQVNGKNLSNQEPFNKAYQYVILAYKSYDSTLHTRQAIAERLPGWKLVARETRIQGKGTLYDEDPVMIVQDSKTLDCAVVFTGTNNDNEITTSTNNYGTGYCGFEQVHAGYRNELWDISHELWPRLRPKLAKCNQVDCVGHSLGGSLCEVFAACANSKRVSDADFQQQMWAQQTPEEMPEIQVGGTVLVEGADKHCEEPPCPKVR